MITPTIGRKVWFWPNGNAPIGFVVLNREVPFDATVIYPHGDRSVNLRVTDHVGNVFCSEFVGLLQDGDAASSAGGPSYATWMPYQVKAAASA